MKKSEWLSGLGYGSGIGSLLGGISSGQMVLVGTGSIVLILTIGFLYIGELIREKEKA